MRKILLILYLFVPLALSAQQARDTLANIYGRTFFKSGNVMEAAGNAFVRLIDGKDTLSAQTDLEGNFYFGPVSPGRKTIFATRLSCHPVLMDLDVLAGDNTVMVQLVWKEERLRESVITETVMPLVQRGDTLVYNAAAVRTMEAENAIEILRQMPGVEIKDSELFIGGQKVMRAYVNGLLLFGDNPVSSLTSILARDVSQIESYREQSVESRFRGDKAPEKERVINIKTKTPIVSAFDGYAQAAAGADHALSDRGTPQWRYFGGTNLNFFSETFLANINAYSNNLGLDGNILRTVEMSPLSQNEYRQDSYISAGVQKYWGDRLLGSNFSLGYVHKNAFNRHKMRTLMNHFDDGGNFQREVSEEMSDKSREGSHLLDFNLLINDKALKNLYISSSLEIKDKSLNSLRLQQNKVLGGDILGINESLGSSARDLTGFTVIRWQNLSSSAKATPFVHAHLTYNPSRSSAWEMDTLASSYNRRYLTKDLGGNNINIASIAGVDIRLWNNELSTSSLQLGYGLERVSNISCQVALDLYDSAGRLARPDTNVTNTYHFCREYWSHGPRIDYMIQYKDIRGKLEIGPAFATQLSEELIPVSRPGRRNFFLPEAHLAVSAARVQLDYLLKSSIPAVEQYRDRLNDSNPFYLVAGNALLKSSRSHRFTLQYNQPFTKAMSQLTLVAGGELVADAIVEKTRYFGQDTPLPQYAYMVKRGATLSTFENTDGTWNAFLDIIYTKLFNPIKLNLTATAHIGYAQRPYYYLDKKLFVREGSPAFNLRLIYRPNRNLTASLSGNVKYIDSKSSGDRLMTGCLNAGITTSGEYNIGKLFFLKGTYSFSACSILDGIGSSCDYHRVGAAAGMRLNKGMVRITLSGNDLLNSSTSYSVSTVDDHVLQRWIPSYGRYYLATISFRLNKMRPSASFRGGQLPDGRASGRKAVN